MSPEQVTELLHILTGIKDWLGIGVVTLGAILGVLFAKRMS